MTVTPPTETDDTTAAPTADPTATLTSLALVCSLKPTPASGADAESRDHGSSSELLARQVLDELAAAGAPGDLVRVADHTVRFGVSTDEGAGDGWPAIRERVLAADVLVIATPIWMGQPASVCKVVLERLDAELAETDDAGRPTMSGKVAVVAVVGNEDGAHRVTADVLQALNDVGVSTAGNASTYWVGEAMGSTDYRDLEETPGSTAGTTRTAARQAVHLARLLRRAPFPLGD